MYTQAADAVKNARRITVFTGAGISVESGIPPFRGANGLWSTYDPSSLEINYFNANPESAWVVIKEIFYDFFGAAKPNAAHIGVAELERRGLVQTVITQNIDNLHQAAGSREVYEFHGNSQYLLCLKCGQRRHVSEIDLETLPPFCTDCGGLLKPDFVFFGESIPERAGTRAFEEALKSDLFILIGTTGEVMPAAMVPPTAKRNGATIIEINVEPSRYTDYITDIFLHAKASEAISRLLDALGIDPPQPT